MTWQVGKQFANSCNAGIKYNQRRLLSTLFYLCLRLVPIANISKFKTHYFLFCISLVKKALQPLLFFQLLFPLCFQLPDSKVIYMHAYRRMLVKFFNYFSLFALIFFSFFFSNQKFKWRFDIRLKLLSYIRIVSSIKKNIYILLPTFRCSNYLSNEGYFRVFNWIN